MLQNLFGWIRRVKQRLFPSVINDVFSVESIVSDKMQGAIDLWNKMYTNEAPWLRDCAVKSLGLPASIASEFARLTTTEMEIVVSDSARADYLNVQLTPFLSRLRRGLEMALAVGGMVFKPFLDGGNIGIDCIRQGEFYPVSFDSQGDLVGAVFLDYAVVKDKKYIRAEYHYFDSGVYKIINKAFVGDGNGILGREIPLSTAQQWANIQPEVSIQGLEKPLFAYFKVPQANCIDPDSPLGVSIYARAVDHICEADTQWGRVSWEYESSERTLYVDKTACGENGTKNPKPRLIKELDLGTDGEDTFHEFSPAIRDASMFNGLNQIKRQIEFDCGMSYGTISDPLNEALTATEILASKQRMYSTNYDIQKALGTAIENLVEAMDKIVTLYSLAPEGSYTVAAEWHDSILTDEREELAEMRADVASGILRPEKYIAKKYGVEEDEAKDWLPSMAELIG